MGAMAARREGFDVLMLREDRAEVARALHAALDPLPAAALLAISDALIAQLAARTADGGTERVGEVFEAAAPKAPPGGRPI